MLKGSDLLVAALEHEGVDRLFGAPGEETLDLAESLHNSKIELVPTRREQAEASDSRTSAPLLSVGFFGRSGTRIFPPIFCRGVSGRKRIEISQAAERRAPALTFESTGARNLN